MEGRKRWQAGVLWTVVLIFGSATRTQVATGTISETVKDTSGGVIPEVQVVLLNEDMGISRTVQTDTNSYYSLISLNWAYYRVTETKEGFTTEVRDGIVLTARG